MGGAGGILIEEDGQTEAVADFLTHLAAQRNGFLLGNLFDGDKRNHVHRAHAGVLALVLCQINQFHRLARQVHGALGYRFRLAQKGDNRPVVAGVGGVIQQRHAGGMTDNVHHRFNYFAVASLADIGHAFQNFSHFSRSPCVFQNIGKLQKTSS